MELKLEHVIKSAVDEAMTENLLVGGVITSVVILAFILLIRFLLVRLVKGKKEILGKDQRRWINRINNSTSIIVLVCFVFVWAPQLHTFALSLTAVAVAIVLTTKELLMCLTGGFLRATTKPFDIGDWITVDGVTGEVMRSTALTTAVEEIDTTEKTYEFTGRTIQIPNSKFLSSTVEKANFIKSYVYFDASVVVPFHDLDPAKLIGQFKKITEKYFAPLRDEAVKFNKRIEKKTGVDFADPEPDFSLKTSDIGHYVFTARLFLPTRQATLVGTSITQDFLSYVHKTRNRNSTQPASLPADLMAGTNG